MELETRLTDEATPQEHTSRITELETENAALKVQLADEAVHRQTLQTRLDDLEWQMKALNTYLQSHSAASTPLPTAISPLALQSGDVSLPSGPLTSHSLVARERSSLQRNWEVNRVRGSQTRQPLGSLKSTSNRLGTQRNGPINSLPSLYSNQLIKISISPLLLQQNIRNKTRFFLRVCSCNETGKRR